MERFSLVCVLFGILLNWQLAVFAAVDQMDEPPAVLLPGDAQRVNVLFPGASRETALYSMRSLPEGTKISAGQPDPVNILCPGLQLLKTAPGEVVSCPAVDDPERLPLLALLPPLEGSLGDRDEDIFRVSDGEKQQREARQQSVSRQLQETLAHLQTLPVTDDEQRLLQAWMYDNSGDYARAIVCLSSEPPSENPVILRFLGMLHIKTGKDGYRTALRYFSLAVARSEALHDYDGQASAHHAAAILAVALGYRDAAGEQGKQALELYQLLENSQQSEAVREFLERL